MIGKQSKLRSLYKFSQEAQKKVTEKAKGVEIKDPKEPAPKKTKFVIKHPQTTEGTIEKMVEKEIEKEKAAEKPVEKENEKEKGPEVVHITGLDQPIHEENKEPTRGKGPEVAKSYELAHNKTTTAGGGATVGNVRSSAFAAGQAGAGSQSSMPHPPIGPKDTLGDIYYKTYTEEARGDTPHHPPWGLMKKDTFLEFSPCRDWFLNSFPPGEVNRERAQTHDGLYHAYIVGEANTPAANHQIRREWRTMVKERGDWGK
ncbi:hypothetical protein Hanom_Chr13g01190861 [Helianthus anomalus]